MAWLVSAKRRVCDKAVACEENDKIVTTQAAFLQRTKILHAYTLHDHIRHQRQSFKTHSLCVGQKEQQLVAEVQKTEALFNVSFESKLSLQRDTEERDAIKF